MELVLREVQAPDVGIAVVRERHERHGARGKDRRGQRWSIAVLDGWSSMRL